MASLILIESPDDPRIEAYRAVRERDLAGRDRLFVAEGEVVLRLLVGRRRELARSLLIAERRVAALGDLLDALPPAIPVYVAPQALMEAIVGFPIHRGVLAVGERPALPSPESLLAALGGTATVMGLVGIANHDNVGGLFRNAAAFGADAVLLDRATCDPLYRKAIRVSVGGSLVVPYARAESADAMVEALAGAGFEVLSLSPSGREAIGAVTPPRRTALLLGAEGPGLPAPILARTRSLSIPMAPGFDSLNVATAGGIALQRLTEGRLRSRSDDGHHT